MREKNGTPAEVQFSGGREKDLGGCPDYRATGPECQGVVGATLQALGAVGYANRVNRDELRRALGLSDVRAVRRLVSEERCSAPICTSVNGGYWLADLSTDEGRTELRATCGTIERRAVESFLVARRLRGLISVPLGQLEIEEGDGGP